MYNPSIEHYSYLNTIFSYLLKTRDLGLDLTLESLYQSATKKANTNTNNLINTNKSINLQGISDADWGGDLDSRKSTTGNIFILNNKDNYSSNIAISWLSKL